MTKWLWLLPTLSLLGCGSGSGDTLDGGLGADGGPAIDAHVWVDAAPRADAAPLRPCPQAEDGGLDGCACAGGGPVLGPVSGRARIVTGDITISGSRDLDLAALSEVVCLRGDLIVQRSDLDVLRLPKLRVIDGSLRIDGNKSMTSVSLPSLAQVTGDLRVGRQVALDEVNLGALGRVGGTLRIAEARVSRLSLPSLTYAGGLEVVDDETLASLDARALTRIDGDMVIEQNPSLVHISLPSLEDVVGSIYVGVLDSGQPSLAGFQLGRLQSVGGDFWIKNNPALQAFALPSLTGVGGNLIVEANPKMAYFAAPRLRRVGDIVVIASNVRMTTFDLGGLSTATSMYVWHNQSLADLSGLRALTKASVTLQIQDDGLLTSLAGLEKLTSTGDLSISACPIMTSLDGLDGLKTVTGRLAIYSLPSLASVAALGALSFVGDLSLASLPSLSAADGLDALRTVEGALSVTFCQALTSLGPLASLTTAGSMLIFQNNALATLRLDGLVNLGNLDVAQNGALTRFDMPLLERIDGTPSAYLTVDDNPVISDFDLHSLVRIGGAVSISADPMLSTCKAYALRDQVMQAEGIGGAVTIAGDLDDLPCP